MSGQGRVRVASFPSPPGNFPTVPALEEGWQPYGYGPGRGRHLDRRGRHTKIPNLVPIAQRPEDITERSIPGHWEGDLLMGRKNRSAVGTLVERKSHYLLLARLPGQTAPKVRQGFTRRLSTLPKRLRQTLTYDRGAEMAEHETLTRALQIRVYFADPHSPWQRGTNENTNGLLRQYLPKGTDLSGLSQHDLNRLATRLNTRPRRCPWLRHPARGVRPIPAGTAIQPRGCCAWNLKPPDAEKVRPGLFQPRKAKTAVFALLHFSIVLCD